MTNKIEVSRVVIERIVKDGCVSVALHDQLRQALANHSEEPLGVVEPVVERQPVGALMLGEVFHGTSGPEVDDWDVSWDREVVEKLAIEHPGEHFELFTAPPELAELQATIVRLTADLDSERTLRRNHAARIHEFSYALKGGQGEAVYQVSDGVNGWCDVERLKFTACQLDPEEYECRVLFTSPPAPVAVVLPELTDEQRDIEVTEMAEFMCYLSGGLRHFAGYLIDAGWRKQNACLDKVNQ